jgi:peptidoglycan/xylan/chitin deacetylase (PgdA/CDA1 family)
MNETTLKKQNGLPAVVISLDFELRWGVHDVYGLDIDGYRENLENVHEVVPKLLKLFEDRNICATWATVGALGCKNWDEYFDRAPQPPNYNNPSFKINQQYAEMDPDGNLHFAPDLLQKIHETPGQELGTHTFSHIFMRERGMTANDVESDLSAVNKLWKDRGYSSPKSLVFPRNQYKFLDAILATSIKIWRGNETPWFYECNDSGTNKLLPRGLRLLDAINPFAKRPCILEESMVRSSLFLRTNLPKALWDLHFSRIKNELNVSGPNQIFHLWWHPHNFGADMANRLVRLEQVLDIIADKRERGFLASKCMMDLVA